MARDRKALLAEQQANLEQLITLISAGINRDLPLRVEQIVRAEVGCFACRGPVQACSKEPEVKTCRSEWSGLDAP